MKSKIPLELHIQMSFSYSCDVQLRLDLKVTGDRVMKAD